MKLQLVNKDFSQYVVIDRNHPADKSGKQVVVRFPNGYGASVVMFDGSYGFEQGLAEMAVLKFDGNAADDYELCYDTPITDDVLGHLSPAQVVQHLNDIMALPAAAKIVAV